MPNWDLEKENRTIQTILFLIKASPDLNKYSLSKLLYYTDALHYQRYGETITNKEYIHIEKSPLPLGINEILTMMVLNHWIMVRPSIQNGKVNGMIFEALRLADTKVFSSKEIKTLRYITMLLGRKIHEESRVFPKLYEHYIITDLFTPIDFKKMPKEEPQKIKKKRKLVAIGDKIYKILFENN